ncbi:hypothetical protein [Marinimicrobium agarilyticum]|uniref:hypothetical protein n=1 Tax=Marinimicrobium agarilyticum TaxID=306546 RepID=UPI0004851C13|nr:hypothetical protein [Marinimicrobium agarilyticum]
MSDKKVYLKAGQTGLKVDATGNYIFLKSSPVPVRVLVNENPTTMTPGSKIRVPITEPGRAAFDSFQVDNLSNELEFPVVFDVGTGDYDQYIMTGEVQTEDVVRGAFGDVRPDTRQTREFIFTSTSRDQTPYSQGDVVQEYKTGVGYISESESQNKIIDGPNDELWFFNRNDEGGEDSAYNIYRMTKEGEVIDFSGRAPYSIDGAGTVGDFAYSEKYGLLALISSPGEYGWVYTIGGTFEKLLELPINPDYETVNSFCFIREDVVAYQRRDGEVIAYDLNKKAVLKSYNIGSITTYDSVRYDAATDTIWMAYGSSDLIIINAETFELISEQDGTKVWPAFPTGKTQWLVKANFVYMAKNDQDPLIIQKFAGIDFTTIPTFGAYEAGSEYRYVMQKRKEVYSGADVQVFEVADGALINGEVIRCALESFYGRRMPKNYMNHVYHFAASRGGTGLPIQSKGGGNNTLERIKETDSGAVLTPCRITITHDSDIEMGGYL